jgi:TctA family transporter
MASSGPRASGSFGWADISRIGEPMRKLRSLTAFLFLPACSGVICSSQAVASLKSRDGKHRAILFMRECGATTDYTTQVSVVNSSWLFFGVGNVFVTDDYENGAKREAAVRTLGQDCLALTVTVASRLRPALATVHPEC